MQLYYFLTTDESEMSKKGSIFLHLHFILLTMDMLHCEVYSQNMFYFNKALLP